MNKTITIPKIIHVNLSALMVELGACNSRAKAIRLIKDGAVEINGQVCLEKDVHIEDGDTLHCGKRFWRQLRTPLVEIDLELWEEDEAKYAKVVAIESVEEGNQ